MKTYNIKCLKCKEGVTKLIIGKVTITGFLINMEKCNKCGYEYTQTDFENLFNDTIKPNNGTYDANLANKSHKA